MVEYFPCCSLEEATVGKIGKAFCFWVYRVSKMSGPVWVNREVRKPDFQSAKRDKDTITC